MAIRIGPVGVGTWGDRHCWACDGMTFAPYTDDGADDLICRNCHAVNTTANSQPRPTPVVLPPLPRKRGLFRAVGDLGGLIP